VAGVGDEPTARNEFLRCLVEDHGIAATCCAM
jgi:hypothetical protein